MRKPKIEILMVAKPLPFGATRTAQAIPPLIERKK